MMSDKARSHLRPDIIRSRNVRLWMSALCLAATLAVAPASFARDAAFMEPGSSVNTVTAGDAIKVEPKAEIDIGDAPLNVARRTTLFFTNQTPAPVQVEKMAVNGDSNVTAEISNDDCSKQGTLPAGSRCSVDVVTTPTAPGAWNVEALLTHNGAGRLARVRISGKTAGVATGEKKDTGLFLSSKEVKPVDFGDIDVGDKVVRSALMVNDSSSPITLYSIDVIEADNGLQRLDQGCAVDMELKAGESCPVTLVWTPSSRGRISTDLIIRHSGQLGFAVIPIRGSAKGDTGPSVSASSNEKDTGKKDDKAIPSPPTAAELDNAASKVAAVAATSLQPVVKSGSVHLIGTVGNRALLFEPDGSTAVVQSGDEIAVGSQKVKILAIGSRSADILVDGKKQSLTLEAVQELTDKAKASRQASSSMQDSGSKSSGTLMNSQANSQANSVTGSLSGAASPAQNGGMR